jgi:glutamate carboxypeptidase
MRALLRDYAARLNASVTDKSLTNGEYVTPAGEIKTVNYAPALEITKRPNAPIQLVLTGHYDTVFPKEFHFQKPRYLDDDTVNGPGTADMKGGILVMMTALEALEQSPQADNIGYTILLSPDEEIGSPGSSKRLMELGRAAHVGLTFEPSLPDGSLAGARKGSGNWALIINGRAAHAGREHHLGRNAIAAMAEFVVALDALNGQREGVTFNIAKIDGGGASNIVPELAVGRFNVRVKEDGDDDWVLKKLEALTAKINAKDGITAKLTGGFTRPPKPMSPANAQVFDWVKQAGALLGQKIQWAPSGGVCEGNNLWAAGCPNVDTLGVIGGDIHSDREFIKLESLVTRAQLTTVILLKLASGEFDAKACKALAAKGAH